MQKKKNPFDALDSEFKETITNMSDDEIRNKMAEVALNEHENREAKKKDLDLKEKQAVAKHAGEGYAEATKMNKLRIAYGHMLLSARGKV